MEYTVILESENSFVVKNSLGEPFIHLTSDGDELSSQELSLVEKIKTAIESQEIPLPDSPVYPELSGLALPTFQSCQLKVGKFQLNALETLVYENEPVGIVDGFEFRRQLEKAIRFVIDHLMIKTQLDDHKSLLIALNERLEFELKKAISTIEIIKQLLTLDKVAQVPTIYDIIDQFMSQYMTFTPIEINALKKQILDSSKPDASEAFEKDLQKE